MMPIPELRVQDAIHAVFAGVMMLAGLVACSHPKPADAQPHPVPDLGNYTPVEPSPYFTTLRIDTPQLIFFSTPFNVVCHFYAGPSPVPGPTQELRCDGELAGLDDLPPPGGIGPRPGDCVIFSANPSGSGYKFGRSAYAGCNGKSPHLSDGGPLLDTGHKITYLNTTCAVGPDKYLACIDTTTGTHGFVTQPTGAWTF